MHEFIKPQGQIISFIKLPGPHQMAIDEQLLEESFRQKNFIASFRIYKWDGIWLSIGKNQKKVPEKWIALTKEKKINIVRRPSGGNAVLHSGGLTYSIIWHRDRIGKERNYFEHCKWLIKGFDELGFPLRFGKDKQNLLLNNCFATSTNADLIDMNGEKRIGSAQLWRNKHVLQHGEIILDPPKDLWIEIFGMNPPSSVPRFISRESLEPFLLKSFTSYYQNIQWNERQLTKKELHQVSISSNKYLPW
tara:strand:+ start:119 stop:862 length:744 start_codon:yes stop_codon:yes gene_type:complete